MTANTHTTRAHTEVATWRCDVRCASTPSLQLREQRLHGGLLRLWQRAQNELEASDQACAPTIVQCATITLSSSRATRGTAGGSQVRNTVVIRWAE